VRKHPLPIAAATSIIGLVLAGCSAAPTTSPAASSEPKPIAVHLTGAGCDPDGLAVPDGKSVLQITNDAGPGEFDVQDADGKSVASLAEIGQGETKPLTLDLATGYYTVECRTDDTTTRLTVGTPATPPVDLGSAAPPDSVPPAGYGPTDGNSYTATNLVANSAAYDPQIVDPTMVDAWGLANRPAGAGGHIWVGANKTGTSLEYVGDVGATPLHQTDLRVISVPGGTDTDPGAPPTASKVGQPTGVIFNTSPTGFIVDQGSIKAPAKFLFASQDGTISAWTEQDNPNGSVTRLAWATKVVDNSAAKAQYFGLAITPDGSRLLAADFGPKPGITSFDNAFRPIPTQGFANPFLQGDVKAGSLLPWNVTTLGDSVYVSYAAVGADESNPQAPSVGEENHAAGDGRVVQYDGNGKLIKILDDKKSLDAPWGIAIAPPGFGKLTGDLLVANFGDGTTSAFTKDGAFIDYLRDKDGKPLVVPGLWALLPGNGASLGDAKAVYFTAGPRAEQDGIFGRLNANQ
jgi:uncharacterized protein (TIGR03118 family)